MHSMYSSALVHFSCFLSAVLVSMQFVIPYEPALKVAHEAGRLGGDSIARWRGILFYLVCV